MQNAMKLKKLMTFDINLGYLFRFQWFMKLLNDIETT